MTTPHLPGATCPQISTVQLCLRTVRREMGEALNLASCEALDRADAELDSLREANAALRVAAESGSALIWPKTRDDGRCEDMGQGFVRLVLDSDNDVIVEVFNGKDPASSVEFCNPGANGGGRSGRTRAALISLLRAIEEDNAETPKLGFWGVRAALPDAQGR